MTIHFICTGNIYRSRLAEAYCNSRCVPGIHGLNGYAVARWQRTSAELVRASDVLVFMESEHRLFCEEWIEGMRQRVEVWGIEDVGAVDATEIANKVERTFETIRQRIDTLLTVLALSNE